MLVVSLVIGVVVVVGLMVVPAWRSVQLIWALATYDSGCGLFQSRESQWTIKGASDPSRRIPRWTDDGQWVMFDFPGGGRDFNRDSIYIVDSRGAELKEWAPADAPTSSDPFYVGDYAPDVMGDKVVFTTLRHACDGSKGYEIASANLDGSGYGRLTDADGSDMLPTWSADGSKVAFVSNRIVYDDSNDTDVSRRWAFNLYVMDADGSNVRSLAPDIFLRSGRILNTSGNDVSPPQSLVWSSSGLLAFREWRSSTLYTVHPEKSGVVTVGQATANPAWSPDGEWIAWSQIDDGADSRESRVSIYVARPDGTGKREVFQLSSVARYAGYDPVALSLSWTPDGQNLRFVIVTLYGRAYTTGLYQINLDEPSPRLIAEIPSKSTIVWSPDDSRALVYNLIDNRYDEGEELLYTIAADGTDKRVLVRYTSNGPVAANGE